jgi:hypothetical protein
MKGCLRNSLQMGYGTSTYYKPPAGTLVAVTHFDILIDKI